MTVSSAETDGGRESPARADLAFWPAISQRSTYLDAATGPLDSVGKVEAPKLDRCHDTDASPCGSTGPKTHSPSAPLPTYPQSANYRGQPGLRVLIVEDDHRLAASMRHGLQNVGIAADVVHDGEGGIEAALMTAYDVVLLDIMLPKVDGVEVSRRLRRMHMKAPILMLTARDSIEDRVQGLDSGADDYLVKPFELREVVARIKALARRHLSDRNAVLSAGPIELDTAAHTLVVDGTSVEITPKEFAILEYFMLNRGRLLTRDQIIEHVWNYDFEGGHNLIETYINRLRGKLTKSGGRDPFVTVRGSRGYRFEAPSARSRRSD